MKPVITGIDLASGPDMTALTVHSSRLGGKTALIQRYIDQYIKDHPDMTIAYYQDGKLLRIEKPVKGWCK